MRRLQYFSNRLLRGRTGEGKDDEHPLEAVSLAKDVLKSHLNQVKTNKEKFLSSNNNEEALALLTSHVEDTKAMAQIAATNVDHTKEDRDILDSLSLDTKDLHQRDLQALLSDGLMDKEEVASLLFDDDVIDFMQYTADALENIENDIMPNSHHRRTSKNTDQQQHNKFQPKSYSSAPNLSRGHMKLPKLKVVEQLKAKRGIHGQRRLEELAPQCRKKCDEENENSYLCNCQRLSECAKELSWYDMAVRTLGGFVSVDLDLYRMSCGTCFISYLTNQLMIVNNRYKAMPMWTTTVDSTLRWRISMSLMHEMIWGLRLFVSKILRELKL